MMTWDINFPALQIQLDKIIESKLPEVELKFQQDVAEFTMVRLRKWNPYKTGLSVGNWIVNRRPTKFASTRDAPGGIAQHQSGIAKIGRFRKPGPIYIVNNTPYITYLEFGIGKGGVGVTYTNRHPELGIVRITMSEVRARFGDI